LKQLTESYLGIGFLPSFVAKESLESSSIKEILAKEERPSLTLYALYPNRKFVRPTLISCIEYLQQHFLQK